MSNLGATTLAVSAAALAVAAASLTGFGMRQWRYRGWLWWVGALWLATAGAALAAIAANSLVQTVAGVLLLQWPVLAVVGMRRFHARHTLPGRERHDWWVLGCAAALALGSGLWPGGNDGDGGHIVVAACGALTHLYAAGVLFAAPPGRDGVPLQVLGAAVVVAALTPWFAALPGSREMVASLEARGIAAALASVVLAFVALTLVCERTERQLRDSRRRLRTLANMDALTQLPNRRHFRDLAALALRADDPGSGALLMFDIDHFKDINDRLGHAAGDRALCVVSGSMLEHLRAQDVAGRHGGDEFVLLLREATPALAMGVAARIALEVQRRADDAQLPPVTLSFGVVQVAPAERIDAAVHRADQALYEAKRQGRSRAVAAHADAVGEPVFGESRRLGLDPLTLPP